MRKPGAGELRGVSLMDLMRMDVTALHTVLPRITTPTLTTADVSRLDPADLTQLAVEVTGFADEGAAAGHLPERVEDAAADIGVIFSFRLEELYAMGIVELMKWRERARERSGAEE